MHAHLGSRGRTATVLGVTAALVAVGALATPARAAQLKTQTEHITLIVKSDSEHGKKGPDGKWHDAFLPANFTVRAGARVAVTVLNYDAGAHSFTAPSLHVNAVLRAATGSTPAKTTFTFTAPKRAGEYMWWCSRPCDPWAMAHVGYMRGYVKVA